MPKKGVVPPHLRKFLFRKKGATAKRRTRSMAKKRSMRRRYSRPKRSRKGPGMISKVTSAVALAIGLGPVIGRADEYIIKGGGNVQGFFTVVAGDYSLGLSDQGTINWQRGLRPYGAILGAWAFKKGMGILGRIAKF